MSENSCNVRTEHDGPVTTVILDRPEARNVVDLPTADALAAAFVAFEKNDTAKVAVLWGAGGVFCAGADLTAVASGRGNRVTRIDSDTLAPLAIDGPMGPTRMRLSKPVIAAVAGFAVAGGLELACWCDLRVVEEDATFGVYCRRWGVPLIDGGTVRLPRLIGQSRALDMILTGRGVGAMEAFAMGLANRIVKNGQSRMEAEKLAVEIARFPQVCLPGIGNPYTNNLDWTLRAPWRTNARSAPGRWRAANPAKARRASLPTRAAAAALRICEGLGRKKCGHNIAPFRKHDPGVMPAGAG